MYRKAHWKVYKVFIWEDSKSRTVETATVEWICPFSNTDYRYLSITLISGVHVYTQNNDKPLLGASAIILKNISQYCCMYNNRIYIEKFYCTYILSITSVTSYPRRHWAHERYSHTLIYLTSGPSPDKVQQPMRSVPGPSVSARFLKYVHTTDDLTYKNRCCLVSWQLDVQ